jgi:hypothetical protein
MFGRTIAVTNGPLWGVEPAVLDFTRQRAQAL